MVEVKICGVREERALAAAVEAKADWVGFVFYPPSPRALPPAMAARLAQRLPKAGPSPAGLFVAPSDDDLARTLESLALAALQVHGVSPERAAAIQARFAVPVWHAAGVASAADLPAMAPGVSRLLMDRKPETTDPLPGGNARSFDWSVLRDWAAPVPWMLAGGLTPNNVANAIRQTGAPAVDVSSGVESSRGMKDPALIRDFVDAVRSA